MKGLLKSDLKRRGLSYHDRAAGRAAIRIYKTELSIKNKIIRGGFTTVFFVQCLTAIECTVLRLSDA